MLCAAACAAPQQGNLCIQEGSYPGDKIRRQEDGRIGVVERRYGTSTRCPSSHPIAADVNYDKPK